jgi:DNA polymerase I-like protein with 3'-5' exonuclease and polymerase domains
MSKIRKHFISRFPEGMIVEADYSQLEVLYLAHITKDTRLRNDLEMGLDMHTVRAAELFGVGELYVTPEQRRAAKSLSFMLQYGAGASHMSKETGLPKEKCTEFITNYYSRYPSVKTWQDGMAIAVTDHTKREVTTEKTPRGYPKGKTVWQSETGRKYTFTEADAPDWMQKRGVHTSFKPTEIKNYPIQGGATGDIVPMMIGKVNRWIVSQDLTEHVKLIATIHDSIVLDVEREYLSLTCSSVKNILESAPEEYEINFGVKFDLKLPVEVNYGPNWAECKTKWE